MIGLLKKILGDENEKEIKKLNRTVELVNDLESEVKKLSDDELKNKTNEFKERLDNGESLDDIMPEAFAVVRETSVRVLGMRHFDVQILGGIVLHQGRISEMKTGEGKTLVATLPAYLNALTKKGVHIVTVNDYLAKRDSEWMGKIYNFLGLEVGLIAHGLQFEDRKKAYNADITYGTNNEFGFDYLRDNMALYKDQLVQRELNYAIIDEVDSILIDEARTPLIISGQADVTTDKYSMLSKFVPRLKIDEDYTLDEKARNVVLTEEGVEKAEKYLGIESLFDQENMELAHNLNQALRAHTLMKKDRDYVLKDGQIVIVDEFTGRLMLGRRFSEGLHQAIEAKEGVKVERESKTLATITFQNYFRIYNKLSGMTGTAVTEEEEFLKIYGLDVVVVPTNEPMIREDHPDVIYKSVPGKFKAIVEEIEECYKEKQPVLVGTVSVEKSEALSSMLKKKGVTHQVLNAKHHEKEAEIVANAGRIGAITISTNMAGRGTDIMLGGNPDIIAEKELFKKHKVTIKDIEEQEIDPAKIDDIVKDYENLKKDIEQKVEKEKAEVLDKGGLHIIGTERHESRRIDNQLRGRSGRQGDPGSSRFYVSLEDDLMRLFGGDNIKNMMEKVGMEEDQPVEHKIISRSIENAQKKVEARNFDIRKHVLQYDDVMNKQREVIYKQRRKVLEGDNLKDNIKDMINDVIDGALNIYTAEELPENWDIQGLEDYLGEYFLLKNKISIDDIEDLTREDLKEQLISIADKFYEDREEVMGPDTMRELERVILLKVVDSKWMDHIDAMDQLRQGIGLRAYGQRDPLIEYKYEGYEMFNGMVRSIKEDVVKYVFRAQFTKAPKRTSSVRRSTEGNTNRVSNNNDDKPKVGRNQPCPCGSGKKYKKCCGK